MAAAASTITVSANAARRDSERSGRFTVRSRAHARPRRRWVTPRRARGGREGRPSSKGETTKLRAPSSRRRSGGRRLRNRGEGGDRGCSWDEPGIGPVRSHRRHRRSATPGGLAGAARSGSGPRGERGRRVRCFRRFEPTASAPGCECGRSPAKTESSTTPHPVRDVTLLPRRSAAHPGCAGSPPPTGARTLGSRGHGTCCRREGANVGTHRASQAGNEKRLADAVREARSRKLRLRRKRRSRGDTQSDHHTAESSAAR
jgi:hypothetical protein